MSKIKPGQFFLTHGISTTQPYVGAVKLCTNVSATRVYFKRIANPKYKYAAEQQKEFDAKTEYCSTGSVDLVRDTEAELFEIQEAGREYAERMRIQTAILDDWLKTQIINIREKHEAMKAEA